MCVCFGMCFSNVYMVQPILLTTCCFPFATMAIPTSEWKKYVLEIPTSLQNEKLKTLSGISLLPRVDAELCYIYDGATVTTQIAYDGQKWRLFEYDNPDAAARGSVVGLKGEL